MILVTDIGYGHTKYAYSQDGNIRINKFPTACTPEMLGENDFGISSSYEYNGKRYTVGEIARYSKDVIFTRTEGFLLKYSPVFIHHILNIEGLEPEDINGILVSMSISEYTQKKDALKSVCSNYIINKKSYNFDVDVYPQGVGIWAYNGKPSNAVIVDIGFNTVDVITFIDSSPRAEFSFGVDNAGTCVLASKVNEWFNKNFDGGSLSEQDANDVILNKGVLKYYRKEYDISDLLNDAKEEYSESILNRIFRDSRLQPVLERMDALIFAGGGAYYLDTKIIDKINATISDKPDYANVLGFIEESSKDKEI